MEVSTPKKEFSFSKLYYKKISDEDFLISFAIILGIIAILSFIIISFRI